MIIKQLVDNNLKINVYIEILANQMLLIAIPEWFWSVELPRTTNKDDCYEELLMQLFVFKEENEAQLIAQQLTHWIDTYKKEHDS
ncbi:YueH family protein [Staphylococcus simiae]|uniref:YueH family protein n=1 Tax=Staphylococcus simiae TaxID=308354 RepID=UPI001A96A1DF|nr:YueH family protein [Staphylococcus simiae]MBO1199369.1 YueH family protein [Staphylococcus simiae]MBO1201640.1 YueH family protein [Staphylococcus simiae]MBO1203760.1 YueH family protein [Staphylococcus simiae]MBO1211662.1 YueH family protein [Staphylococcus simiae]MBO1230021.1 YueH family protein [Staphylococcus simiae]